MSLVLAYVLSAAILCWTIGVVCGALAERYTWTSKCNTGIHKILDDRIYRVTSVPCEHLYHPSKDNPEEMVEDTQV